MPHSKLALILLLTIGVNGVRLHAQAASAPVLTDNAAQSDKSVSPETVFAEARRLSEQGKYDDAIAALQGLASRNPPPAGVSHELG